MKAIWDGKIPVINEAFAFQRVQKKPSCSLQNKNRLCSKTCGIDKIFKKMKKTSWIPPGSKLMKPNSEK